MSSYHRQTLPPNFAVLSGPNPPDDFTFKSDRLQILWNYLDEPWSDAAQHYYIDSDEAFIVLKGSVVVEVDDEQFTLQPGEVCFFPAGVFHSIVTSHPPVQAFVIRAPATSDKVYRDDIPAGDR